MTAMFGTRAWRAYWLWCLLALLLPAWVLPADAGFTHGLLWRIEPADGAAASYLFGTIHSEDPRVLALPAPVLAAFDAARVLVLEVVPEPDVLADSMAAMTYQDGRTLADVVPDVVYQDSIRALAARGLPEQVVRSFKPWAVMTLLSMPEAKTGDFLDMRLYQRAVAAQKPVRGLESMQEQLAVFEHLSLSDQVALLRLTLASQGEFPALFEALIKAYQQRDLGALLDINDGYLDDADSELMARFEDTLVAARNERMAQRIAPMIRDGAQFVAVGALHLPGPGGLLERLSAAGNRVERVY